MQTRFMLPQSSIPTHWYNLTADFPEPMLPPLHPGTRQPVSPADMSAIFPENLVAQEMSPERWIEIPEKCAICTRCGGPRRCCARFGWRRR